MAPGRLARGPGARGKQQQRGGRASAPAQWKGGRPLLSLAAPVAAAAAPVRKRAGFVARRGPVACAAKSMERATDVSHQVNVDLDDRSYPIYIGEDLMSRGDLLRKHILGKQVRGTEQEFANEERIEG